ncbi:MAG: hypothetical protein ABII82_16670 [Verrucomicrobiota bacterium]
MNLPTAKDISPRFGRGDEGLDEAYARKTFSGKDLSEAEALFRENALFHSESLLWMGQRGFQFYIDAFIAYIRSPYSAGDSDAVNAFLSLIDAKREETNEPLRKISDRPTGSGRKLAIKSR